MPDEHAAACLKRSEWLAFIVLRDTSPTSTRHVVHQTCGQGADDEAEHRAKYYEPDRCVCDGRAVRFESHLCLHILSSAEPELIKNAQDRERESAQHKYNSFSAVVPDYRCVVHDFGIATKQLIAPPDT